jgi:hypothetical protein
MFGALAVCGVMGAGIAAWLSRAPAVGSAVATQAGAVSSLPGRPELDDAGGSGLSEELSLSVLPIAVATLSPPSVAGQMGASVSAAYAQVVVAPTVLLAPTPTVDEVWADLQDPLARAWSSDTPGTIALLSGFHERFPNYQPAREKLYAALIAAGSERAAAGDIDAAAARFREARAVQPERLDAIVAERALTPTAVPEPTSAPTSIPEPPEEAVSVAEPQAPPAPRLTTVQRAAPAPAPPPRPAVTLPRPTPTKQPFTPPGR